jgi:hypothetical protein
VFAVYARFETEVKCRLCKMLLKTGFRWKAPTARDKKATSAVQQELLLYMFTTVLNSRINSWETWFIFYLQKININQHCNSIHGCGIIMIHTENILRKLMAISITRESYSYNFVHTWTAFFLEHLTNMSFMASIQAWIEPPVGSVSQVYSLVALAHLASCCLFQRIKFHT